ncbi:MAG TPA: carboxymuconolactone decarboxylase family protein [Actinomycetota bacterium]|nr:carboxymuconolactone decarboxylase family protein [Actinomycetota bacterium]
MNPSALEGFPAPEGLKLPPARALMSLLSRAESIGAPWSRFARALMSDGRLDPQLRELVVLRVAFRRKCAYVLAGHLQIAAHCGLSRERIDAATGAASIEQAGGTGAAVIRAADELVDYGRMAPATRAQLEEFLGHEELIEIAMLAGQYVMVGMLCQTFDLIPEPAGGS